MMTTMSKIPPQEVVTAEELSSLPDVEVLRRSLKPGSVISTRSSYAIQSTAAVNRPDLQRFVEIGVGFQGAVFEQLGNPLAFKKEHPGNSKLQTSLENEYAIHAAVRAAFDLYSDDDSPVHVPRLYGLIPATDNPETEWETFWHQNLGRFPTKYQNRDTLVRMERILPLPKITRKSLVRHFYPRHAGQSPDLEEEDDSSALHTKTEIVQVLNHLPNKHCLVRTYLGKRGRRKQLAEAKHSSSTTTGSESSSFTLRNFPLYLGDMEDLGLDTRELAISMGRAFAIMHWGAGVNGDDVEFVLGTCSRPTTTPSTISSTDPSQTSSSSANQQQLRVTRLFLLDFGQCDRVQLVAVPSSPNGGDSGPAEDERIDRVEAVYQSFKGAMVTGDDQLFIPHYKESRHLFEAFKCGYIAAGRSILVRRGLEDTFDVCDFMREYEEYAEDFL